MSKKLKLSQLPNILLGVAYFKKGKYQRARSIFSKLVDQNPNNAYLNFRYGMCFYKEKKWIKAHHYISKAVELAPQMNSWKKQLITTNKYISNNSKIKITSIKEKINELEKKANSQKDLITLQWEYAISLYDNQQYWMALIQLNKYLEMKPNTAKAYYQLGIIYEKLNDFDNAITSLGVAVKLDKRNKNYYYRLGYCYEKNNQLNKAREYYNWVILNSDASDDVHRLGIGLYHSKRGLWVDTINAYEEFIAINKYNEPDNFYHLAFAYERAYLWDKAADNYVKAIELAPNKYPNWYFRCGQAYEKIEQFESAYYFYNEAVSRSNSYNDYWYFRLAYVLSKLGRFKESSFIYEHSKRRKLLHSVTPSGLIKDKEEEFLTYYTEYYETLPIQDNIILFESFFGNNISCNPYAILKYMLEHNFYYRYVLVIQKDTEIQEWILRDKRIILVQRNSDLYIRYLVSAKYLVNNVSFPYYFIRRPEQKYLNTWHGTPIKTLGKDIKSPFLDHSNVARNFLHATHIISQNEYTTDILLDKYDIRHMYTGKIANIGYPRVDLTLNLSIERRTEICQRLGLDKNKPVILYAPTWRGTSEVKQFNIKKLQKDLEYIASSNDYQFLFRGHHLAEKIIADINLNVCIVPRDIDTNELLGITDILISDYSSIVYDFLALNRPVISYIYDFDEYIKERGLYIQKGALVGYVTSDIYQLKEMIIELSKNMVSNIKLSDIKCFAYLDDGKSTERVIDFFFNDNDEYLYSYERKPVDLFFVGPLLSNGIVRSFNNLISSLDNKHEYVLLISPSEITTDSSRMEEFNRLPNNIAVFGRTGRMPMTLEEIWLRKKFKETFEFSSLMFKDKLLVMYQRECRRMFGDTKFNASINFEGYALFWVMLISQLNAKYRVIFQHNDKYSEWKTKFPYLKGVFIAYQFFDKIVSVSEKTRDLNQKNLAKLFQLPDSKFVFCNNTINYQKILDASKQEAELEENFSSFNGIKVLNIGRMSHEKDQIKLIRAFARIAIQRDDIRLYILGTGSLKKELETLITELNMGNKILLLGQKTNPFPYLKQADLFVLSSNHEGQPMVLLEALTLGTPIVATDIVGNRSVLDDKYGLLVENSIDGVEYGINQFLMGKIDVKSFDYKTYQDDALKTFTNLVRE